LKRVLVPYPHARPEKAEPYICALRAASIEPVPAPSNSRASFSGIAGLLLLGGTDLNPQLYGEDPHPETQDPDDERDAFESELLAEALLRQVPIFAICRGMQLLNVHLGGSLQQHLASERHLQTTANKAAPAHSVAIEPGTLLAGIAGRRDWQVNSRHHQAVARPAAALRVAAREPETGVIEAVEFPGRRFVLGVQWHPEDQAPMDPEQHKLFLHFAEAL